MADMDPDAQTIVDFMNAEKAKGHTEVSRADIQRGTGLGYNQLVESLAKLETSTPSPACQEDQGDLECLGAGEFVIKPINRTQTSIRIPAGEVQA